MIMNLLAANQDLNIAKNKVETTETDAVPETPKSFSKPLLLLLGFLSVFGLIMLFRNKKKPLNESSSSEEQIKKPEKTESTAKKPGSIEEKAIPAEKGETSTKEEIKPTEKQTLSATVQKSGEKNQQSTQNQKTKIEPTKQGQSEFEISERWKKNFNALISSISKDINVFKFAPIFTQDLMLSEDSYHVLRIEKGGYQHTLLIEQAVIDQDGKSKNPTKKNSCSVEDFIMVWYKAEKKNQNTQAILRDYTLRDVDNPLLTSGTIEYDKSKSTWKLIETAAIYINLCLFSKKTIRLGFVNDLVYMIPFISNCKSAFIMKKEDFQKN